MSNSNRHCRVNGADLFVEDFGSGPLMVFMHGFSFDSRMWQPQLDFFARDYRVLAYDARGFGRSSLPGNAPWSAVDDLSAVLDEVAADPAILVAHSMAAIAACDFCRQSPGRIKALILVSPSAADYRWPEVFMAQWAAYQDLAAVNMDAARNAWLGSELFTRSGDNALVAQQMRAMIDRYSGWHWQQKKPVSTSALPSARLVTTIMMTGMLSARPTSRQPRQPVKIITMTPAEALIAIGNNPSAAVTITAPIMIKASGARRV